MATGRNFKAVANDIGEGFVTINPIFLKPFDTESLKLLYDAINKKQNELRAEPFPYGDVDKIRRRNLKLQRVYNSLMLIKNYARERRIILS
ncbi:MAG TPA: hypothetical protein VMB78_04390 [Dissulfurispiraceae bacterium]|nr:hypothetical protein [Dissulfurispiraceae bacterium]